MANFVVSLNKDPGMTSIEKLDGGFRLAQLLRLKIKMLFEIENAMTHTANIDPTKPHRSHIAGLKLNTQDVTRARQAMVHVGGKKAMGSASLHPSYGLL